MKTVEYVIWKNMSGAWCGVYFEKKNRQNNLQDDLSLMPLISRNFLYVRIAEPFDDLFWKAQSALA